MRKLITLGLASVMMLGSSLVFAKFVLNASASKTTKLTNAKTLAAPAAPAAAARARVR
jgi:hypothetical protein